MWTRSPNEPHEAPRVAKGKNDEGTPQGHADATGGGRRRQPRRVRGLLGLLEHHHQPGQLVCRGQRQHRRQRRRHRPLQRHEQEARRHRHGLHQGDLHGSLPATVKLYRSAFTGGTGLDTYLDVNVTHGTGTNADCSDFTAAASGSSVYTGTLNAFNTSFASGISLSNGAGAGAWGQNDAVTYKFTVSLQDNNSANGLTSGVHSFVWETHNN